MWRTLLLTALWAAAMCCVNGQFQCYQSVIDIRRDVCPQREGPDPDCDKLCKRQAKANHATLLAARCNLRTGGVLFSQFGIASFVCQCCIGKGLERSIAANEANSKEVRKAQIPFAKQRLFASSQVDPTLARDETNPILKPYFGSTSCSIDHPVRTPDQLSCSAFSGDKKCAWLTPNKSNDIKWYQADGPPNPEAIRAQFGTSTIPDGSYLMLLAAHTTPPNAVAELHSCPIMCTEGPITITNKHWRSDDVEIEICYKELGEKPNRIELCAPQRTKNDNMATEILPEARNFSVYLKISGMKGGDMVLIDDLKMDFVPCKAAIEKKPVLAGLPIATVSAAPECSASADCSDFCQLRMVGRNHTATCTISESPNKKRCNCIERLNISQRHFDRTCIGRNSGPRCEQKCIAKHGDKLVKAECRRQQTAPYVKQCLCSLTKGELLQKNVETIASRETEANVDTKVPCKGPNGLRYCALKCRQDNRNRVVRPTCTPQPEGDQSECQCGAEEGEIEAGRSENGGVIQARDQSTAPSADQTFPTSAACDILRCDFEQFDLCGWKDLSGSRADFRRLIVAQRRPGGTSSTSIPDAVHGRRYVISRLGANGKVGMVAEGIELREPLVMRMEIFRTAENLDVKVCLNSIDNCVSKENSTAEWQLRTWQETYVSLPQDTSKIFIIGENNGTDWSALGIDKIELLQWPADSNKTPTELAC